MLPQKTFSLILLSISAGLILQACAAGMQLLPKSADPAALSGTYTLILYGGRHPVDLETMAILVDEKSPYPVEVYALESMYKVTKGLSASQALHAGNAFLRSGSYTLWDTLLRKIADPAGKTIGYELKPLYRPMDIGTPEPVLSAYSLKDGTVFVYISLHPMVKQRDESDDAIGDPSGP